MKKTIFLLLTVMLIAALAISCSPEQTKESTKGGDSNSEQKKTVKVGDVIERGTYPATAGESYAGKPITWKVLAITDGRALVISEMILTKKAHVSGSTNGLKAWADSEINAWLNKTGSDGFITQYGLENVSMAQVGDVNGKVFLLTKTEAETYFSDNASRVAYDLSGTASYWLLATINSSVSYFDAVTTEGKLDCAPVNSSQGVRPAFWINL